MIKKNIQIQKAYQYDHNFTTGSSGTMYSLIIPEYLPLCSETLGALE